MKIGKYCNKILQVEIKNFRAVSYRNDLHEQFSHATKAKSPIKLTKFKHIQNRYDSNKKHIEVNSRTLFGETDAGFTCNLPGVVGTIANVKTVNEIQSTCCDKVNVSLKAYLSLEYHPIITMSPLFHFEPVMKKEVCANDNTGSIKLTLWESKVRDISKNGVII